MGYSMEMKESVIKKVLLGERSQYEIANQAGISRSTLGYWLKKYKKDGKIILSKKEKRPQEWTAEERIGALIKTGSMSDEERISWCREKGIFAHHLEQWKKDAISSTTLKPDNGKSDATRRLKKEIVDLKKELHRKDRALAETAALLVLKKKADFLWGEPEDD